MYLFMYHEDLVHVVMEAEKPRGLQSAGRRLSTAEGMMQPKSQGLGTSGADAVSPSLKAGEDLIRYATLSSEAGKKGANSSF